MDHSVDLFRILFLRFVIMDYSSQPGLFEIMRLHYYNFNTQYNLIVKGFYVDLIYLNLS